MGTTGVDANIIIMKEQGRIEDGKSLDEAVGFIQLDRSDAIYC
jgi:hypothetical protein